MTTAGAGTPLLEIDHLEVRFPVRRDWLGRPVEYVNANHDVSLAVEEGETVGIVGESGSGKSTLALAIVGLVTPSSGAIRFRGRDWSSWRGAALRRERARGCQIVFQDPMSSLDPRLAVWQVITEALEIRGGMNRAERRARALELARQVGLDRSQLGRYPHELSGGQRQRIAIARALAASPELLLLDEPTSALDVSVQAQVLNLLLRLQQELGLTYLFVSHDVAVIRHMCDRVAVMYRGEVVESGDAVQVLDAPRSEYTRALVEAVPRVGGPRVRA